MGLANELQNRVIMMEEEADRMQFSNKEYLNENS